jgi:hypothetical protein
LYLVNIEFDGMLHPELFTTQILVDEDKGFREKSFNPWKHTVLSKEKKFRGGTRAFQKALL